MGLENHSSAADFRADNEGSIPFTRCDDFNGLATTGAIGGDWIPRPVVER
jgi:hypothetical protein